MPPNARAVNTPPPDWQIMPWREPSLGRPLKRGGLHVIVPGYRVVWWRIRARLLWPLTARELKAAGYRRTGWRKWEPPR
jgi:hypothetical protein